MEKRSAGKDFRIIGEDMDGLNNGKTNVKETIFIIHFLQNLEMILKKCYIVEQL